MGEKELPEATDVEPGTAPGGCDDLTRLRVLLMDDDSAVLACSRRLWERSGCDVVTTRDGGEALARYGESLERGRPFHLVVLDLTVENGMGGREANERLRDLDPGCVTVVSSGYSSEIVIGDFRTHGFWSALSKPYGARDIAETIRKFKDTAAAGRVATGGRSAPHEDEAMHR